MVISLALNERYTAARRRESAAAVGGRSWNQAAQCPACVAELLQTVWISQGGEVVHAFAVDRLGDGHLNLHIDVQQQ